MSWFYLSLLAAAMWAGINVLDKYIISKRLSSVFLFYPFVAAAGLLTVLISPLWVEINYLPYQLALVAMAPGALYIVSSLLYFKAIKQEEVSRVVPLFYLSPIFTAFFAAVWLGEVFTLPIYVGIFLTVMGAMLLMSRPERSWRLPRTFYLMLVVAMIITIDGLLTKWVVEQSDFWTVWWYGRLGGTLATLPIILIIWPTLKNFLARREYALFALLVGNDLFDALTLIAFTAAVAAGPVTLVNAVSAVQPFFVLLLSGLVTWFFPHVIAEDIRRGVVLRKAAAIALMFAGVLLIT